MMKAVLIGVALTLAGRPTLAQRSGPRNCLHESPESPADRTRRQQAVEYATKVNVAETRFGIGPQQLQRGYRPLEELANLPAAPAGFAIEFHHDDLGYAMSLKDTRDPCHFAIFTDEDKLIYEAVPRNDPGSIIPLGTR
jgi:hypothetical protein